MGMTLVALKCDEMPDWYYNRELTLVKQNSDHLKWSENPVLISQDEKDSMNFNHVVSILQRSHRSPSEIAGLNGEDLDPVISDLDQVYWDAMWRYGEEIRQAGYNDLQKINELKKKYSFFVLKWALGGSAVGAGTGALAGTIVFPIIGTAVGAAIGAVAGGIPTLILSKKFKKRIIQRNGCLNRIRVLNTIDTLEKERFKEIEKRLDQRAQRSLQYLQDLKNENQACLTTFKQLKQIVAVFKALFPDKDLVANQLNVEDYLNQLKNEVSCYHNI